MGIVSMHHAMYGLEEWSFSLTLKTARRLGARLFSPSATSSDTELSCFSDDGKLVVYIESACETDGVDDTQTLQDELGGFLAAKLRGESGACYDVSPQTKI